MYTIGIQLRSNPHGRQLGRTAMSWMNSIGRNAHLNQCYSSNSLPLVQVASRVGWTSISHELVSTQVAHTQSGIPPNECQQHVFATAPHEMATMATTHVHHNTNGIELRVTWVLEHMCGAHKDHKELPNHLVVDDCMFLLPLLHMK